MKYANPRFIPALAGNINLQIRHNAYSSVHPRARGEHRVMVRRMCRIFGSSPRSRGTWRRHQSRPARARFIPALAGNIALRTRKRRCMPVHPRARGEHSASCLCSSPVYGSSPRSRGTFASIALTRHCCRFIPALAGNITQWTYNAKQYSVHPRARGEHLAYRSRPIRSRGSSPRSRGTYNGPIGAMIPYRFIPALAGNIAPCECRVPRQTVHPRARGEHLIARNAVAFSRGSSPRSRGTSGCRSAVTVSIRFIPALAGNINLGNSGAPASAVHPRARGEHLSRLAPISTITGSSPRSRGTY